MGLSLVSYGHKAPKEINVIIEISAQSVPIKYEVDKGTGALFVDRFISTPMRYPCDYGYVPNTLSEDGDPVDVLVLCPLPLNMGCVITCRPIGLLNMTDEAGRDIKILAVPADHLTSLYHAIHCPEDLPPLTLAQIQHFFEHYKDLEPHKWVKIVGWEGAKNAHQEIMASIQRYEDSPEKPAF